METRAQNKLTIEDYQVNNLKHKKIITNKKQTNIETVGGVLTWTQLRWQVRHRNCGNHHRWSLPTPLYALKCFSRFLSVFPLNLSWRVFVATGCTLPRRRSVVVIMIIMFFGLMQITFYSQRFLSGISVHYNPYPNFFLKYIFDCSKKSPITLSFSCAYFVFRF